jgi:hypothetical protein
MNIVRITGYVDENGHLQTDEPLTLPPGKVAIVVSEDAAMIDEYFADAVEDAAWEETLLRSPHVLNKLLEEGL